MSKKIIILPLFLIIVIFLSSCSKKAEIPYETQSYSMGTLITQKIYGKNSQIAAAEVNELIQEIDDKMSSDSNSGEVYEINSNAGNGKFIPVSPNTYYLLEKAKYFNDISGGAFNITIGPIVKLWGIGTDKARLPSDKEIKDTLKLVNINDLELSKANHSARLKNPGQRIDLGGIAKGFAGKEAAKIYKNNKIKSAFINLGGNAVVIGNKPDGSKWRVGVQNPRAPRNQFIGIIRASDKQIVTSGDYERYFMKDETRYHHIFNPETGYPADSGLMSVTVVANLSEDADGLTSSLFILGLEKGMELVKRLNIEGKDIGAIFITKEKKVYITDNLIDDFTFDDESKEFDYVKKR